MSKLVQFLDNADVPVRRKDLSNRSNLFWLSRNIQIRNEVPADVMAELRIKLKGE